MSRIDESRPFVPVAIAVLTVSDTRDEAGDVSGRALVERLTEAGHRLADRAIVRDEQEAIVARLRAWIVDPDVDVVIATGGTGVPGRAVTPEAFEIGRASCREKGCQYGWFSVVAVSLTKKK